MNANTTSSSRLRKSGLSRSVIGASAVGSMGAALQTAHAKIVYSGIQNISTTSALEVDDVKPVTLSSQSNKGADFSLWSYNDKGYDTHYLYDQGGFLGGFEHFTPIVSTNPSDNGALQRLDKGETIDSQGSYETGGPQGIRLLANSPNSQWSPGTEGYFGYRFDALGWPPYHGWGRITLSEDAQVMTLVDWAYEDTGAPIQAGQIPEPTTSLLLTASLAIAALWRRRQASKD